MTQKRYKKVQKRRCVSFRPLIFQRVVDAGRALEMSLCAVVEQAVVEFCERRGIPEPTRAWWLEEREERREERRRRLLQKGSQHFSW